MHIYQTCEIFGLWIHILQIQKYEIYYMRIINVYILPYQKCLVFIEISLFR
jgi:hypothetical protein